MVLTDIELVFVTGTVDNSCKVVFNVLQAFLRFTCGNRHRFLQCQSEMLEIISLSQKLGE